MAHLVAVVVPDRVPVFELAVPCEVFGVDRSDLASPWYEFRVVAAEPPPLTTAAGFTIDTPYGLDDLSGADTIVVPAWRSTVADHAAHPRWRKQTTAPPDTDVPPALLDALRTAHARGARILGICTGAFVLAAAGLLDGRRATTHWLHADDLARRFPRVDVDPRVLYIDDGQVLTSAGTAAGVDLCLHVVRSDYGSGVANAVARRMVVPPHRDGGQAQFIDAPVGLDDGDTAMAALLDWIRAHLDDPLTVEVLAARSAMSPRTFARKFRAATGTSPHRWVTHERVARAQELLETTDLSVDQVAERCGLGSAANLRKRLREAAAVTPTGYRRTFRAAG